MGRNCSVDEWFELIFLLNNRESGNSDNGMGKRKEGFAEMVKDYGEQELIFRKNIENAFHSHSDRVSFHDR